MSESINYIIILLAVSIVPFVYGLVIFGLSYARTLTKDIKHKYSRGVLDRLIGLAGQKVLMMEQVQVNYLKKQLKDGKVTKEEIAKLLTGVKHETIRMIKRDATAQNLWKDAQKVFIGDGEALERWISDVIESQVSQIRITKKEDK